MAKTLSRSTVSRIAYRFFSTSRAVTPVPLRAVINCRRSSPRRLHMIGRITALRFLNSFRIDPYFSCPPESESNIRDPLFPGCDYDYDYDHWVIVMDKPGGENANKQQMIDCYVQTLAKIVGSEEEAKRKMYNVSCESERYFGFGCEIDEETSHKLEELPGVKFVLPDACIDPEYKDYGAELFVNGEVVPRSPERQKKITELTTQIFSFRESMRPC